MSDLVCLARAVFRHASSGSTAFRAAATALTFCDDVELSQVWADSINTGSWSIDGELLARMYQSGTHQERAAVLRYSLLYMLEPPLFRRMFCHAWRNHGTAKGSRACLADTLTWFLMRNPQQARTYARYIRALLVDARPAIRLKGVQLVGFLSDARGREVAIVESAVYGSSAAQQHAAVSAVWYATGWRVEVSRAMAGLVTSPRLQDRIKALGMRRSGIRRKWLLQVHKAVVTWAVGAGRG